MNPSNGIQIVGWADTFECAASRKLKRMKWISSPGGIESGGMLSLRFDHPKNGMKAYGIFMLLCQFHSTNEDVEVRLLGEVRQRSGKFLPLNRLASILSIPISDLIEALEVLKSESVGWVREISPNDLPTLSQTNPKTGVGVGVSVPVPDQGESEGEQIKAPIPAFIADLYAAYGVPTPNVLGEAGNYIVKRGITPSDAARLLSFVTAHRNGRLDRKGNPASKIHETPRAALMDIDKLIERAWAANIPQPKDLKAKPMKRQEWEGEEAPLSADEEAEFQAARAKLKTATA